METGSGFLNQLFETSNKYGLRRYENGGANNNNIIVAPVRYNLAYEHFAAGLGSISN
jgi:hypothetical protein